MKKLPALKIELQEMNIVILGFFTYFRITMLACSMLLTDFNAVSCEGVKFRGHDTGAQNSKSRSPFMSFDES
jgi:hypothetical protein